MPASPPKTEERVKALFSLCRFKLFHQGGDYVACFGEPSMADDGWIINLPASSFFEGNFQSLPFDTDLSASWVKAQAIIREPLSNYISPSPSGLSWVSKTTMLGIPSPGLPIYETADLFRDIATILKDRNQFTLALPFIQAAYDLRKGPVITQILADLTKICSST